MFGRKDVIGLALAGSLALAGLAYAQSEKPKQQRDEKPPPKAVTGERQDKQADEGRRDKRPEQPERKAESSDRRDGRDAERRERQDEKPAPRAEPRDRRERKAEVEDREGRPRAKDAESELGRAGEARSHHIRKARSMLGAKVSIRGDHAIGTVEDILFDDDGYVEYLLVHNKGKYVLVPWMAAKFNFAQRTAAVDISEEKFREVPTFSSEHWPNFSDTTYRQRIYGYYGVRPGQERRLERQERRQERR